MNESEPGLADTITAALSPRDTPSRAECDRTPSPAMLHALEQFNRGEYWEQHETLEEVWRAEPDQGIRNLYKGIIQVGVGFYHLTRGNYRGVIKVLARGINYLKPYAPSCYGIDVGRLIREASVIYDQARRLGPDHLNEIAHLDLPQVHLEKEQ